MATLPSRLVSKLSAPHSRLCGTCYRPLVSRQPSETFTLLDRRPLSTSVTQHKPLDQLELSEPRSRLRWTGPSRLSRQASSSSSSSQWQPKPSKPKPASHKPPKRRLQAASAPLRNAPSVTRGPLLQCIAHTTAEKYDLVNLGIVLRDLGVEWQEVPEGDRERAFVIGPWKGRGGAKRLVQGKDVAKISSSSLLDSTSDGAGDEEDAELVNDFEFGQRGEVWVFNSGNFVTWGLTEEEGKAFLTDVIRRRSANIEVQRLPEREYEVEEMDFIVDPDAQTDIRGNLILLGAPPTLSSFPDSPKLAALLARYTLSLSLSRSSSLSVLEGRLEDHIASVSYLPRALERSGAQPMQRREVIRKLGELMTLRMAVNTWGGGLEDTPDIYWAEPQLEEYFDWIATEFEIKERIETFNKKCDYAQEIQSTLRALLTEASGHRMEVIIIVLIAVEVVLALLREGEEIGHKLLTPLRAILGIPDKAALATISESIPRSADMPTLVPGVRRDEESLDARPA
ncbi:hypothetical protein BD324DRAFT_626869 [Kockovaella imperatae]|uniref:DUF155 domain-containing protein n=1 Tax=Kockovaella imperatae TaxID=4999 RepID=A0A1Y1UF66_9TREE|nr:hypothetical protein BD324DRAFT_626869 [Kockovaella imperatae]ORX36700.1 hypothetical protein BD324DRAFT_626869 [Kockovaella imperatae]